MLSILFASATIAMCFLVTALYCCSMAFVGRRLGATVERVGIGIGPLLATFRCGGCEIELRPCPVSGHVKFLGNADPSTNGLPSGSILTLSPFRRLAIFGAGPLSAIVTGLILVAIPVIIPSRQLVATSPTETEIVPCAAQGLAIRDTATTWKGQYDFFVDTVGEYLFRLATFRSLKGWGGLVGCLVTCTAVAQHSTMAWLTCIGVLALANGFVNAMPVPMLNGGHALFVIYMVITGREVAERTMIVLSLLGLVFILVLLGRMIWLDVTWFWGIL